MTLLQTADIATVATSYGPIITGAAGLLGVAIGSTLQVFLQRSERSQKYKDEIRADVQLLSSTFHVFAAGLKQLHELAQPGRNSGETWKELAGDVEKAYLQMDRLTIGLIACKDEAVSTTAHKIQAQTVHIFGSHTTFNNPEALNPPELETDIDELADEVYILLSIISPTHRWYRRPLFRSRKAAIKTLEAERRDDHSEETPAL